MLTLRILVSTLLSLSLFPAVFSAQTFGSFDLVRSAETSFSEGVRFSAARASLLAQYPSATFVSFTDLAQAPLGTVDCLILTSGVGDAAAISPLSPAEQSALFGFVAAGGGAILMPDNSTFSATAPAANLSLVDPFGIVPFGTLPSLQIATVASPTISPITNGPFGTVTTLSQLWPGALTTPGPYGLAVASNLIGIALVDIPPCAIAAGSGAVAVFSDLTGFLSNGIGSFVSNEVVFLNAVSYCIRKTGSQVLRNSTPPNPPALMLALSGPPTIGQTWEPFVDHTTFVPNATLDILGVSALPTSASAGQLGFLLCDIVTTPLLEKFVATPGSTFSISIPSDCSFIGRSYCTQAISLDGTQLQLANAIDIVIGAQ